MGYARLGGGGGFVVDELRDGFEKLFLVERLRNDAINVGLDCGNELVHLGGAGHRDDTDSGKFLLQFRDDR